MAEEAKAPKSLFEKASMWIGLIGSVITIVLTIWNTNTKFQIDKRQDELKALEISLKARSTAVEESKEKVGRYQWVLGLFPALDGTNEKQKNFTISLIRLALTQEEAEQLFTGLQSSADTSLQTIGQKGITAIQDEPITMLVSKMNAATAEIRKSAVADLAKDYKSSSQAITLTLRMYDDEKASTLSPSGIINGLYFLSATDPSAWNKEQIANAEQLIKRLNATNPGPQTKSAINNLSTFVQKLRKGNGG